MKLSVFLSMLLISGYDYAQKITIDSLPNAAATASSYISIPVYGKTNSGGLYGAGMNSIYAADGKPLPVQFVRLDFGKKTATYKTLPSVLSGERALWITTFDGSGNFYLSLKATPKKVILFNLKDSIYYKDLGNPFKDSISWAYSMSLGRDGKMYFGGSGRSSTNWSVYDPATKTLERHPSIDPNNDFVLSIAGDSEYVYAQTGQYNSIQLWSIRKKDDFKKSLGKIPNNKRIALDTREDGIYATFRSDNIKGTFKLVNGDTVRVSTPITARRTVYEEVNNKSLALPKVSSFFDPVKSKVLYSLDDKPYDSINVSLLSTRVAIKKLFAFPNDPDNIYFAGEYYGNYYRYNLKTNTSYLLGTTGFNIYSSLALNDSIMLFGGYPNGFLMKWNKNQPWTTENFINGKSVDATDSNANPKILGFWKSTSKPPAGFHHTSELALDAYGNIVGAGNVIRIGNGASIGAYNIAKDSLYGIDYDKYAGMGYNSIARWRKSIVYSMSNQYGRAPKLYFYNSNTNTMTDSLDLGYDDYGEIFIKGDMLYGISRNRVYKLDLAQKQIVDSFKSLRKIIYFAHFLSNGKAIVNMRDNMPVPSSIVDMIPLGLNHDFLEASGYVYAVKGYGIVRVKGLIEK